MVDWVDFQSVGHSAKAMSVEVIPAIENRIHTHFDLVLKNFFWFHNVLEYLKQFVLEAF